MKANTVNSNHNHSYLAMIMVSALIALNGCTLLESEFHFEGTFVSHEKSAVSESWDTLVVRETEKDTYSVERIGVARIEKRTVPIRQTKTFRLDEVNYVLTCQGSILRPDGRDGSLSLGERRFSRIDSE